MKESLSTSILITSISLLTLLIPPSTAYSQRDVSPDVSFQRQVIREVKLEGVKAFPRSAIKRLLFTKPNKWYNLLKKRRLSRSNVAADTRTIKRFYERRGFLFAKVRPEVVLDEENRAIVTFHVEEGRRCYLRKLELRGGVPEINRKFNKTMSRFKAGEPVDASQVVSAGFKLRDIYFDNGYPYARIYSQYDFNGDSSLASVSYVVAESVFTVVGQTAISTLGLTQPQVVKRELLIEPGKRYSQRDIIESEQRLYSAGLFRYVSLKRDDSTAVISHDTCKVDFKLRLAERKPFFVNGGIGVGREENFELVLRGSARWGNRNIRGTGRKVFVSFRPRFQITDPHGALSTLRFSDLKKKLHFSTVRTTFELIYIEPWFLNRRIHATAKLIYEPSTYNPILSYRYDRFAGEVVFTRELDRFTTGRVTGATEYLEIRNVPADQQEAYRAEGDNQIRRYISIYGERDTRDNLFIPQRGSYSFVGVEYVGGVLGGDFSYKKAQFSWSRYQILIGQNIIASRLWFGWLDDFGKNGRSRAEDRFIIGGANTIRGYAENSLGPVFTDEDDPGAKLGKPKGGRYLFIGNIEIRRPLFWRFGGSVFLDAGNTYWRYKDITPLSIAFTSGMGVQFFTPIGPIRFDYAVRLKKDFDLGAGNYHLSVLYAF